MTNKNFKEARIMNENEFINSFEREMSKCGFNTDCDFTSLSFKYDKIVIILEPHCWYFDDDYFEYVEWIDNNGIWEFTLSSKYSEDSNLNKDLYFNPTEDSMEQFVKKVIEYVKNADYCDHSKQREEEREKMEKTQEERDREWIEALCSNIKYCDSDLSF